MKKALAVFLAPLLVVLAFVAFYAPAPTTGQANIPCYREQGGAKTVAGSGCEYEFQSGSTLDVQDGTTFSISDLTLTDDLNVTDDANITGDLVVTGTSDLKGNVSDSGGVFTFADNVIIDGAADLVQLTVQGNATQTSAPFVVENSGGTDLVTVSNTGLLTADDVTVVDDLTVTDDLIITGLINQDVNEQNIGIMSIMTASVEYTDTAALFTVGASEIWIVHDVLVNVTENYDCTGNDCAMLIGDSNDVDGFVVLADAELQAADTEFTGAEAGWQGMSAATKGVYLDEVTTNSHHNFVYSGSETIDLDITGTDPAGGAATIYILYTRIQ